MKIRPFRALRPRADLAARIPSYPYDVINSDEARKLAADDPYSFLHVVRAEIDLPEGTSPYAPEVYAQARKNLDGMVEREWMVRDERPAYYIYRLTMGEHVQTGILGAAAVDDYRNGSIKRHEHTRPEKEEDRIRVNLALEACPGPVFLAYHPLPELNAVVTGLTAREPHAAFTAPDDIGHALWAVDDPGAGAKIEELFGKVRATYVADGHHRAAAAAKVGAKLLERPADEAGDDGPGDGAPPHFFLAAHFPADQLKVLAYNRIVRDLNGLDVPTLLERFTAAGFHVKEGHRPRRPQHRYTFGAYVEGSWYHLTAQPAAIPQSDPVRSLDVSILAERILEPILGIGDPRTDKRIDCVGGIRGMDELERLVNDKEAAIAFALYPTALADVMAVADAGGVMPPKSTWFEPKLRSGMVVQLLRGDRL